MMKREMLWRDGSPGRASPGNQRVASGRPARLAGEQTAAAVPDHDDHRRMKMRVVLVAAPRAALAPLALEAFGVFPAARTVSARALPPEGLHRHAAERQQIVGEARALHRDQRLRVK